MASPTLAAALTVAQIYELVHSMGSDWPFLQSNTMSWVFIVGREPSRMGALCNWAWGTCLFESVHSFTRLWVGIIHEVHIWMKMDERRKIPQEILLSRKRNCFFSLSDRRATSFQQNLHESCQIVWCCTNIMCFSSNSFILFYSNRISINRPVRK